MKNKTTAIILAILLGWAGGHKFYCGDTKKGIIYLCIYIFTCGIGGIFLCWYSWYEAYKISQCESDEAFNEQYVITEEEA